MLREFLISEAMHALGIPTTRSLAVTTTAESVRRESLLPGAVLTRIAASHIRVGTFEWAAASGDVNAASALVTYTLARHFPDTPVTDSPALALLNAVAARQAALIAQWQLVGFIHGVMNTDNMALSGETIDYGPCAFMDHYDPATVFSSIDHHGRYAYANQPHIARWNLARLAETWRVARRYRDFAALLGSALSYQAGISVVIALAAVYAEQVLGFKQAQTMLLIFLVNIAAAAGALAAGAFAVGFAAGAAAREGEGGGVAAGGAACPANGSAV
jgi:uncharacterized protein YdiU (UPF0061 family)